jgi:DNA-binding response OmpR family regulator
LSALRVLNTCEWMRGFSSRSYLLTERWILLAIPTVRVLVVEDDPLLSEGLVAILSGEGHSVEHVATGNDADKALTEGNFHLAILDIGLPDIDGFEVLRRLRDRGGVTVVLVLTARDAVEDRVHGLDLGADDYLSKPFSVREFEARVRALLRRDGTIPYRNSSKEQSSRNTGSKSERKAD